MDRELVEKVTRMVISELETHASSFSEKAETSPTSYEPLTDRELAQWNGISAKLGRPSRQNSSVKENVPLTDEEINRWDQLSKSISAVGSRNHSDSETEKVRFSPF